MSSDTPRPEHARRLRHDLGKYVSLQVRWVGEGASPDDLREALMADLLATRRGPDGATDALTLWAELRADWRGDWANDPDVRRIEHAMAALEPVVAALRAGTATHEVVERGVAQARVVSEATKALADRLRREG